MHNIIYNVRTFTFRSLPEPLMTFKLHKPLIAAASKFLVTVTFFKGETIDQCAFESEWFMNV